MGISKEQVSLLGEDQRFLGTNPNEHQGYLKDLMGGTCQSDCKCPQCSPWGTFILGEF